jgi:hypothetical protein
VNDANGTERMAQLEKALVRSLEALDRGDVEGARAELMRVAPATQPEPLAPGLTDSELDAAFEDAEPDLEHMLDADSVAQAAIAEADRVLESEADDFAQAEEGAAPRAYEIGERFATATMAGLLERQGDVDAASRIRAALVPPPASDGPAAGSRRPSREHVIHELETWLDNLRGGARS